MEGLHCLVAPEQGRTASMVEGAAPVLCPPVPTCSQQPAGRCLRQICACRMHTGRQPAATSSAAEGAAPVLCPLVPACSQRHAHCQLCQCPDEHAHHRCHCSHTQTLSTAISGVLLWRASGSDRSPLLSTDRLHVMHCELRSRQAQVRAHAHQPQGRQHQMSRRTECDDKAGPVVRLYENLPQQILSDSEMEPCLKLAW